MGNTIIGENLTAPGNSYEFDGLSAGTYSVTVTDSNDKTFTKDVTLTQPTVVIPDVTFTATVTNVSVYGASDGKITVNVITGTSPFTYSKDGTNFQSSNEFTGLVAGTYTITVKDSNNKTTIMSVIVDQPAEVINDLVCNVTFVNASVNGYDGSITVTITSGNAPYTYTLTGVTPETTSATTMTFYSLSTGSYVVTVTDNKSKTFTTSVTISTGYKVGDSYLGGKVISINSDGTHGVIMKLSDEIDTDGTNTFIKSHAISYLTNNGGYRLPTYSEFNMIYSISNNNISTNRIYWVSGGFDYVYFDNNIWNKLPGTETIKYYVRGVKDF